MRPGSVARALARGRRLHLASHPAHPAPDFAAPVHLAAAAPAPLKATLVAPTLEGQDQTSTSVGLEVPTGTPSGRYSIRVSASDGARQRSSTLTIVVDSDSPVATAPTVRPVGGTRLTGGTFRARAIWAAATDAYGTVAGYQAQWRVDGGDWSSTVSMGSGTRQLDRNMSAGHTYALRIRARDAAGNVGAWATSPTFAPGLTQNTSSALARTGTWTAYRSSVMSGGSTLYARSKGRAVSLPFTGRAIALVAPTGPSRGTARIWIDGTLVTSINLHTSVLHARRIVYARSWTTSRSHTIRVVVAGTAGHPRVDVDAFIVIR